MSVWSVASLLCSHTACLPYSELLWAWNDTVLVLPIPLFFVFVFELRFHVAVARVPPNWQNCWDLPLAEVKDARHFLLGFPAFFWSVAGIRHSHTVEYLSAYFLVFVVPISFSFRSILLPDAPVSRI
jgi:hypothetical protein